MLILWGYNPSYTRLTHATAVVAALKRGMRLIVVDPRHVGLASKADLWLRVRPGTDGALALGLANLMIERGWYDRDFIRNWSNGPHPGARRYRAPADRSRPGGGGDARRLLAWDDSAARLVPYDTATGHYDGDTASPRARRRISHRHARRRGSLPSRLRALREALPALPAGGGGSDLLDPAEPRSKKPPG